MEEINQNNQNNLSDDIAKLTAAIDKLYRRQSAWSAFSSGLMHSLGYFIGFALIATVLVYALQQIPLIPIIGDWLGEIMNRAMKNVKTPTLFPFLN